MALPIVTAENYYSPEMNMAYMGSTQFKAFEKCEAAALAELKGEYHPPSSTALLVGGYIDAWFSGELPLYQAQHPEIFKRDGTTKTEQGLPIRWRPPSEPPSCRCLNQHPINGQRMGDSSAAPAVPRQRKPPG